MERRDPYKLYHKMTGQQLQALTPAFNWNAYLQGVGRPRDTEFNVTEPEFYKALNRQLVATSLDDLKAYLRWNALRADAEYLSSKAVQEDFDFYDRILHGSK